MGPAVVSPGDVVPWSTVTSFAGLTSRKGMQYRPRGGTSVFLMSRRTGAPYDDVLADEGRTLVYVGHDANETPEGPDPRTVDQPLTRPDGRPSDNALFLKTVEAAKTGAEPEPVRVFEKVMTNVWVYNGLFRLVDAWAETENRRRVFKFRLTLIDATTSAKTSGTLPRTRVIPSMVKYEVWKRDEGKCVLCGASENLHFDHELPYSKGGTSLLTSNVRILCASHNLAKGARIE